MSVKCEDCDKEVSANVEKYSKEHFKGKVLCYDCQKKVRGKEDAWEYDRPEGKEEQKGTEDVSGGTAANGENAQKDDGANIDLLSKVEGRKVDNETIGLVTDMPAPDKENFYRWLKSEYGVDDLETLNIDQKREVLEQTRIAVEKRSGEKENVKQEEDITPPALQQEKRIEIDWDKIPIQTLIPKLERALEYTYKQTDTKGVYYVASPSGDSWHNASINSCECENWVHEGSSINPCKHMIRVKYTDEEIRAKLKEFGAVTLPATRKERGEVVPFSEHEDMAISDITPRLAEIGKIKIGGKGEKKVRGFLLPEKWDHFEIATLLKDEEGRLVMDEDLNAKIGKDCKALDVELCYDSPVMNMPTFYALLSEGRIVCMGNGHIATKTKVDDSKEEIVCKPRECEAYKSKKCKLHGRLSVILSTSNRLGGVYVFRTTGFNSIRNIMSSMRFLRGVTGGVLGGIPLRMVLLPMTVKPHEVEHNVKIYAVNIEYAGSPSDIKQAAVDEIQRRMVLGVDMQQTEKGDKELLKTHVIEEAEEEADAEDFIVPE